MSTNLDFVWFFQTYNHSYCSGGKYIMMANCGSSCSRIWLLNHVHGRNFQVSNVESTQRVSQFLCLNRNFTRETWSRQPFVKTLISFEVEFKAYGRVKEISREAFEKIGQKYVSTYNSKSILTFKKKDLYIHGKRESHTESFRK